MTKHLKKVADKLAEDKTITDNAVDSLDSMIESSNEEDIKLAQMIIERHVNARLADGLNNDQTIAFSKIITEFEEQKYDAILLKGYAGTGKTFLVKRIIESILTTSKSTIAITAPTNKAVYVLHKNSPYANQESIFEAYGSPKKDIVFTTIHKLMNLKEVISNDGQVTFTAENPKETGGILDYNYIIIDEVSMLDDSLFNNLMKFKDKVQLIFMGRFMPSLNPSN